MDDLDHRHLGVQFKLWHLQDDAPGMVFWHPRGYAVYRVLEDYVRGKMRRAGYEEVRTPQLRDGRVSLRERDGAQADLPLAAAVSRLCARARPGGAVTEAG
ncbi:hypothetical protein [Bradyrhizobium jicamae]|uniref:hypothetical protein n=1 Tax=Bradyrhizobium jicamae TaxID=280332 RepID=UPI0020126722|nr:hypothetical protein [Bradyrhizobium jicamae]